MKEILRTLRNKHNYSQSAVASYLEISRQMYNKYETGLAEPSLKNIKKLCELYKVSSDIFLNNLKSDNKVSTPYDYDSVSYSESYVSSPTIPYGNTTNQDNSKKITDEIIKLIPLLNLHDQISLMAELASIIEKQSNQQDAPVLKTKKIKEIPDKEYNKYLTSEEAMRIRKASLSSIREILINDEW